MAKLRDPQSGCPWDVEQDFASIAPYTIEEAYEVADAIARNDMADLRDELGDLLLQVVFHARMAEEAGEFDFEAVAGVIADKMLRRHPHVFGSQAQREAGMAEDSWEAIKEQERAAGDDGSLLAGIAKALPSLKRAQKLGKRASRGGFDWPDRAGVHAKIVEELKEIEEAAETGDAAAVEAEVGDLLFAVVNLARHLDVEAEEALSGANNKFERRFRAIESELAAAGRDINDLSLDALEERWQAAKTRVG